MTLLSLRKERDVIDLRWLLPVDAPTAWAHLVRSKYLPTWLGTRLSGCVVTGETVVLQWADGRVCRLVIEHVIPGRELGMTWQFSDEPESYLLVHIHRTSLMKRDGENADADNGEIPPVNCVLQLHHDGLEGLSDEYAAAWRLYLARFEHSLVTIGATDPHGDAHALPKPPPSVVE